MSTAMVPVAHAGAATVAGGAATRGAASAGQGRRDGCGGRRVLHGVDATRL